MRTRELKKIGIPKGEPTKRAFELIKNLASQQHNQKQIKTRSIRNDYALF